MFIKSMVIDGFKSHGDRIEINGFDPLFNAITQLTRTRKSNFMDAIRFLLDITDLSQVEAINLQELVFNNGQAGVTKATVTITFDNTDKNESPIGYEHYDGITITRQVVIGGDNNYSINGTTVQNSKVQNLFRSVPFNNTHLIMKSRITDVLIMNLREIVSMIEEAAEIPKYESERQQLLEKIREKNEIIKNIDAQLYKIGYEKIKTLTTRQEHLKDDYMDAKNKVDELEARFPQLCFEYRDPDPNFNRYSVKGLVCKLFKPKDPQMAKALEAVAGEMLYNVVVDNEETGIKLLKNGRLQNRVTFILLNKITARSLESHVVQHAEELVGPDNVKLALSLISYNEQHHKVMQFVFGASLVCKDAESARKVAFNPKIMTKTVALDGDVFDPSQASFFGGAHFQDGSVFAQLDSMVEAKEKLNKACKELSTVEMLLRRLKYNELMTKKAIVSEDKNKIESSFQELDNRKKEALRQTWRNVNKDFDSICSMLLPGANAKLQPRECMIIFDGREVGMTILDEVEVDEIVLDELEVQIAIDGVWKSLLELFDYQRKLVALSLILAVLLLKPAPIYILDEMDATLSPSHTENIGHMLRTHFKHSQFIFASLKYSTFNNANVVFKTIYNNKTVTLSRHTQHMSSSSS